MQKAAFSRSLLPLAFDPHVPVCSPVAYPGGGGGGVRATKRNPGYTTAHRAAACCSLPSPLYRPAELARRRPRPAAARRSHAGALQGGVRRTPAVCRRRLGARLKHLLALRRPARPTSLRRLRRHQPLRRSRQVSRRYAFVRSFVRSFVRPSVHSFVRSFVHYLARYSILHKLHIVASTMCILYCKCLTFK